MYRGQVGSAHLGLPGVTGDLGGRGAADLRGGVAFLSSGAGADSCRSFRLALEFARETLVPFRDQPCPRKALRFGFENYEGSYGSVGETG